MAWSKRTRSAFAAVCGALVVLVVTVLAWGSRTPEPSSIGKLRNRPTVNALPFTIEGASYSDLYKKNLKVSIVEVRVNGGTAAEWSATGIAVAEKVASLGADSIRVKVKRGEISQSVSSKFRDVAIVYHSPDTNRSVWNDGKQWQVYQADPSHLSTQRDADIDAEFGDLTEKFIDRGMDLDVADKKAGAIIALKYHFAPDWQLPSGNYLREIPRDQINVDATPASQGLERLYRCLEGRFVYAVSKCDDI